MMAVRVISEFQGIGTDTPYLQVDGYTFAGKYVPPMGSYLVLEEKPAGIGLPLKIFMFPRTRSNIFKLSR
jgi:hypothetical protein